MPVARPKRRTAANPAHRHAPATKLTVYEQALAALIDDTLAEIQGGTRFVAAWSSAEPEIVEVLQQQMLASAAGMLIEITADGSVRPVTTLAKADGDDPPIDQIIDVPLPELDEASFATIAQTHTAAVSQTSALITNMTTEHQAVIRRIVAHGFEIDPDTGLPDTTAQLARSIEEALADGLPSSGLNLPQARALERQQSTYLRNLLDKGVDVDKAKHMTASWRGVQVDRLRKHRAITIARTEVMTAANTGRRAGVDEALDAQLVDMGSRRRWSATGGERMCPICSGLNGEIVGLNEPFPGGYSQPPAHPRCRCTWVLLPPSPGQDLGMRPAPLRPSQPSAATSALRSVAQTARPDPKPLPNANLSGDEISAATWAKAHDLPEGAYQLRPKHSLHHGATAEGTDLVRWRSMIDDGEIHLTDSDWSFDSFNANRAATGQRHATFAAAEADTETAELILNISGKRGGQQATMRFAGDHDERIAHLVGDTRLKVVDVSESVQQVQRAWRDQPAQYARRIKLEVELVDDLATAAADTTAPLPRLDLQDWLTGADRLPGDPSDPNQWQRFIDYTLPGDPSDHKALVGWWDGDMADIPRTVTEAAAKGTRPHFNATQLDLLADLDASLSKVKLDPTANLYRGVDLHNSRDAAWADWWHAKQYAVGDEIGFETPTSWSFSEEISEAFARREKAGGRGTRWFDSAATAADATDQMEVMMVVDASGGDQAARMGFANYKTSAGDYDYEATIAAGQRIRIKDIASEVIEDVDPVSLEYRYRRRDTYTVELLPS